MLPLGVLNDPAKPPKAQPDATAVTPTAQLSVLDRLGALLNWTDPFPYRPRPVSPPNPHRPPADATAVKRGPAPISDAELEAVARESRAKNPPAVITPDEIAANQAAPPDDAAPLAADPKESHQQGKLAGLVTLLLANLKSRPAQ